MAARYSWDHVRARRAALARLVPGTTCPLCGKPMWPDRQALDLDHVQPLVLGGPDGRSAPRRLTHASCNRSAGARVGNALRAQRRVVPEPPPPRTSRDW